jgi:flagellar motor switch/type III secretory pathway protein FliN
MNQAAESALALIPDSTAVTLQKPENWSAFLQLPCQLSMEIPIHGFTVSALLRLAANDVISTHWLQGSDVPLHANGKLIGWTEFEVNDDHLAARLTQIA